jgi:hypothetical protein
MRPSVAVIDRWDADLNLLAAMRFDALVDAGRRRVD